MTNKVKKYFLGFTLILAFVGQAFALDCATGTGWGDFLTKSVTKTGDYYEISTPEELAWISCKVRHDNNNFKAAKVKLTQSIDMQGKVFIPIAAGDKQKFSGTIDGQGFTISNLYINGSEINNNGTSSVTNKSRNGEKLFGQNIGLVGVLNGGTIKNLTLKDAQIYAAIDAGTTGNDKGNPISVGTLVGWVDNASTIENCVASGSIETSGAKNRVGGIIGNVKNITITNCVSSVSVTASGDSTYVGGIVGALRNGGTVNMSSCVYSGNSLYTVDGSVGAIAGSYENVGSIKTEDLYYSDEYCKNLDEGEECSGLGYNPKDSTFNTTSTENLNSEEVVCNLNGGTWNEGVCAGDTSEVWSVGQSDVSMNGSDGYKITFNANGGTFAPGARTSKILAKDAAVTADEIGVPTLEGKKFAGWATTANAEEPSDLGVAHAAITIYAVWYDFYQVAFNTGCDTAFSDAKFPDSTKTKTISVAKHGTISVDGFSVPTVYEIGTDENKVKYYFTGWAYEPKSFDVNETIAENDTLHLSTIDVTAPVTLYAVWTKAPTYSVTFDASLHGKTDVHFVRMVTEGETVSRPDTVITDDGYKVVGWCIAEDCTEENEYTFTDSLKGNLVLHARWEIESYSINYELNGGTNASTNLTTYNVNSGDIVFAAPTKEGSKFEGWFYDANLTNPATQIDAGSTGDKTIYAKWTVATYTIQYLSGTAISATVNGTTKTYGESITLRDAPPQFAVGGCTFDGWSKVDYGQEGYAVDYAFGATYSDNANLKLFPHWVCNTYKITYEVYGVEATNRNNTSYTGPYKVTLQNAFVSGDPVKMDNWYLEPTFKTSVRYLQNIDKDLTLYAKWYNTIIYNPGSRLKAVNSKLGSTTDKKFLDSTYTFRESIKDFVLTNYTLDGWSTTDGGEKVYELGETYTTNANLTLYPHWVESRDSVQYGAVKVYTYAIDGRKEAVINGNYGGGDEPNSEEADAVEITSDITVNSVTLNRTFNASRIATLCVPFEIDADDVVGADVYKFKTVVKNEVD
ncbi:MAG: InlB B-repeat-containing protein, partial [Fibrobacter sp.]|nr:InlB B-repeat-containing protein [Fibrobacter sp.]